MFPKHTVLGKTNYRNKGGECKDTLTMYNLIKFETHDAKENLVC